MQNDDLNGCRFFLRNLLNADLVESLVLSCRIVVNQQGAPEREGLAELLRVGRCSLI